MASQLSFKSVLPLRVSVADAQRLASQSLSLGNPDACPLTARHAGDVGSVDEYSRPQSDPRQTLNLNDSACSSFVYPAQKLILDEQVHRPVLGPYQIGSRGPSDLMLGSHRDQIPVDLYYTSGTRFNSGYGTYLQPPEVPTSYVPQYNTEMQRQPITSLEYALQRRLQ